MNGKASILASVHAVKSTFLTGSEIVCASPICSVRFEQTGLKIEPKRYCSDQCRQQASIIRRAAKLLEKVSDREALKILRGSK
jgi:hypothetical protein